LANQFPYDEELTNISIVYRLMRKYEKALEFAQKSLGICISLNDSLGIAQTYISIGKIYGKKKNVDSANYYFDLAYDLSIKNGFNRQAPSALINKSDVLLEAGEHGQAIDLLRKAVSIATLDDDVLESAYFELAVIFNELGYSDSTIYYASISLDLSMTSSNLQLCQSNTQLLAQLYEKEDNTTKALEYLKQYMDYTEEINEHNNQSEISDLRIRIETLENEQEINELNQRRDLEELKRQRLLILLVGVLLAGGLLITLLVYRQRVRSRQGELERTKLKGDIEKAQGDLSQQTLHMVRMNNCLNDIESQILSSKEASKSFKSILKTIKYNKSLDKEWEHFNLYFGNVHRDFFESLTSLGSKLSNHEQRVCALIRLNLSNQEIATLLNIETRSVIMLKYRIKKKLNLDEATDLREFLLKI
jgi:tetratricopeptide (TPR) repeat protein